MSTTLSATTTDRATRSPRFPFRHGNRHRGRHLTALSPLVLPSLYTSK
jgi:hypothetical protein